MFYARDTSTFYKHTHTVPCDLWSYLPAVVQEPGQLWHQSEKKKQQAFDCARVVSLQLVLCWECLIYCSFYEMRHFSLIGFPLQATYYQAFYKHILLIIALLASTMRTSAVQVAHRKYRDLLRKRLFGSLWMSTCSEVKFSLKG